MAVPLDHLGVFPSSFLLNHHILPLNLSLSVSAIGQFVTLLPSNLYYIILYHFPLYSLIWYTHQFTIFLPRALPLTSG